MKVTLISKPTFNRDNLQKFLRTVPGAQDFELDFFAGHAECLVETAGRLCYMSFPKPRPGGNPAYIQHILEAGHGSVLEHANFSFVIEGVSRSLTHELVRHRAGVAYSQLSQRYVDESVAVMIVPPEMEGDEECVNLAQEAWAVAKVQYKRIFDKRYRQRVIKSLQRIAAGEPGWIVTPENMETSSTDDLAKLLTRDERTAHRKASRQEARCVLPNATETKITMTGNIRAWRHILEMRGSLHADAEIRRLAIEICGQLRVECPVFFDDFELKTTPEGVQYLNCKYHKV